MLGSRWLPRILIVRFGTVPADGTFNVSRNYDNGITVSFSGDDWWTLNFAAPGEAEITPGMYKEAARFPFQGVD